METRLVFARNWEEEKTGEMLVEKAKTSSYMMSKFWNLVYSMVTIVNNTILCT